MASLDQTTHTIFSTYTMKFIAKLQEFKKYLGMDAEIRNKKGDLLDSVTINNKGKNLKFNFDKDDALLGKKKTKLTISFTDTNGADGNLRKSNGDLSDLSPDSQTFKAKLKREDKKGQTQIILAGTPLNPNPNPNPPTPIDTTPPVFTSGATASVQENVASGTTVYTAQATDDSPPLSFSLSGTDSADFSISRTSNFSANVTINSSPDFETKSAYSFNVLASDAGGNTSSQGVNLTIVDIPEFATVSLTPLLDTITAAELSSQSDVITADLGNLGNGFLDSVVDGSTTDNDQLTISTNATFDLDETIDNDKINRIQNIESIKIVASNDDLGGGNPITLDKVVNLKSLDIDGTFTQKLRLVNWASTGATEFDFSGITSTQGVTANLADAGDQTVTAPLNFKGSSGDDIFSGLNGDVTMSGGPGNDFLVGSRTAQTTVTGGAGTDQITFLLHNAQNTVRLHRQISETSKDTVLLNTFKGFNDPTANSTNSFDLIEIDAATFTNYNAGQPVQQQTSAAAALLADLSNTVITTATAAATKGLNFDNKGDGLLAFSADGVLTYSASGDFTRDAQDLFDIGAAQGSLFVPTQQITVV